MPTTQTPLPDHDEYGDEHGTDWVGHHPPKILNQQRRDDDPNTAQRVRQDVQEYPCRGEATPTR